MSFTAPGNEMERFFYSLQPAALSRREHAGSAERGPAPSCVRTPLRDYADRAGFANVEVLDVEHPQFRLYRLS